MKIETEIQGKAYLTITDDYSKEEYLISVEDFFKQCNSKCNK